MRYSCLLRAERGFRDGRGEQGLVAATGSSEPSVRTATAMSCVVGEMAAEAVDGAVVPHDRMAEHRLRQPVERGTVGGDRVVRESREAVSEDLRVVRE